MKFEGLYTALVTPFDEHDAVCEKTLTTLLHRQLDAHVDGITILGTTGEAATLEEEERRSITKTTVRECKGKTCVMVGCTSPSTKTCIDFAKKASDDGVDALLIATPYYNKPTQEGIFLHFKAVSDSVSLPICVYNIASRCGQNIDTTTMQRLAALENIVCVKEASGSLMQVQDVIEKVVHTHSDFQLLSGDDASLVPIMALGGHGVVSVISNLLPKMVKKLVYAMLEGDLALARALHYALKPIVHACFVETNPIPVKRMLQLAGLDVGTCRLPLCKPLKQSDEAIAKAMHICQHLIDDECGALV